MKRLLLKPNIDAIVQEIINFMQFKKQISFSVNTSRNIMMMVLLLFSLHGFAQKGIIRGKVQTEDSKPLEYVNVGLTGSSRGVVTDQQGVFVINNLPAGKYTLEVSFIGYESQQVVAELKSGEILELKPVILAESSKKLDEVTVVESRSYKESNVSNSLRLNTPLLAISQNIQLVTGKTLSDQQIISMSDGVVRNVSGATRVEHWGDLYTNITMRGSQVQAFRNGFNVVNSYWGPLTEDMSFVDHIEFVKGPASFMLANGDPSGLYNVVTKKPTGLTKGEVSLVTGSYGMYRVALDLDGKLDKQGKLLYRINLAGQQKNAHRSFEFNNRYSVAPVITYLINNRSKLTVEYTLQLAKMSDVGSYYVFSPKGYGTLPVDFTTMPRGLAPTRISDHSLFINFQHDLSDNWKLTAQTAGLFYKQRGSDLWPSVVNADGTMIRNVYIWDAQSTMTMAQVYVNGKMETGNIMHKVLGGIDLGNKDYMADWGQTYALDSAGAEFNPLSPNYGTPVMGYPVFDRSKGLESRAVASGGLQEQHYSGAYIQDEIGFWEDKFRVTLAGRYTYVSQSAWGGNAVTAHHFSPRVGISLSVDDHTAIYGLYDQAFTPQSGNLANGEDVKPITGNNTEFGIKRDWAGGKWNTTLSVYRILKKNELTSDPNSAPNSGLSIVLGEKTAQGLEFDLKGSILPGLSLIANYAYTDSKVTQVAEGVTSIRKGDVIPGFAKHTVNGWLYYRLPFSFLQGVNISAGASYMADRATSTWSSDDSYDNLPDYFKVDAGISWEHENLKLVFNVFNLLDDYLYSGGYYSYLNAYYWQTEAPRNLRLSLSYRF